jgi:hypothetical protein
MPGARYRSGMAALSWSSSAGRESSPTISSALRFSDSRSPGR